MCELITTTVAALFAGGGATAAGATAGAATSLATTLQTVGTALAIGGSIYQGVSTYNAAKDAEAQIETQKRTETQLNAVREQRSRAQFRTAIAQQRSEIAARGVDLGSPTAVFLGQSAAREMVFESQTIRQGGQATQAELTGSQRALRARGTNALFRGGFSAAGRLLSDAPDLWPELLS